LEAYTVILPEAKLHRHEQFHSDFLEHDRDVLVWLPPGYEDSTAAYPVLYMHDGQNLFDPDTAYQQGEHWRVGETATALIEAGRIEPLIVVGIYNSGKARIDEYTPTGDKRLGGGHADEYGRMIIEELKPLIDRAYRTKPDAANTGIGGSSLGALVSLHLGFTHPAVFTKIAALSPSVWWGRKAILKTIREARSKPPIRLWVDMGTAEGRKGLDDARLLKAALVGLGFTPGADLHYAEYEGGTHSEQAWSERVGPMLQFLFPVAMSGARPQT
jgi:predicted alpha/beta superfamily hydrolase